MATVTTTDLEDVELPVIELDKHYEVVDGQIVEEPPLGANEGVIASFLDQTLGSFARSTRPCCRRSPVRA